MTPILVLFIALLAPLSAQAESLECLTVGVTDGDTIKVRCGQPGSYEQITVRFAAIDAPEQRQPFGQRAKQTLSDLIYMKPVQLDCYKTDRYQRKICNVSTPEIGDVGLAMVRAGMAWWYRAFAREQTASARAIYEQVEAQASQTKQGLWSDPHATPPWDWRKTRRSATLS